MIHLSRILRNMIKKGEKVGISLCDGCDIYKYEGYLVVDGHPKPYIFSYSAPKTNVLDMNSNHINDKNSPD